MWVFRSFVRWFIVADVCGRRVNFSFWCWGLFFVCGFFVLFVVGGGGVWVCVCGGGGRERFCRMGRLGIFVVLLSFC